MKMHCAAATQPPCTCYSIHPRLRNPLRDPSLARYPRSAAIPVYAVASTSKTVAEGYVSRTSSRGATPATASTDAPRSPRPKGRPRTREPVLAKDANTPSLDNASSNTRNGPSTSSSGDQTPASSSTKSRLGTPPPTYSSSTGNPSANRNSSGSSSSSSSSNLGTSTLPPTGSGRNSSQDSVGNPPPPVYPTPSDTEQHDRVQDPEYQAALQEFRAILTQETLTDLERTLGSDDASTLMQALGDLEYMDAVERYQESQVDSGRGGRMDASGSGAEFKATPPGSRPIMSTIAGVKSREGMSLEEIKNANSRELAALGNMSDFKTYLRGLFSRLDDNQFALALNSLGEDLPMIERLYNDIYAFNSYPEDELKEKYNELTTQMEGLLRHFTSKPVPTIAEVLGQQGTSASTAPLDKRSPTSNSQSPEAASYNPTLGEEDASYSGYNPAQGEEDVSYSGYNSVLGEDDASYSGYDPAPGVVHFNSVDSSAVEEGWADLDDGYTYSDVPTQAPGGGGKPARSADGVSSNRWGASVTKGRRPKGRGALFPRTPPSHE